MKAWPCLALALGMSLAPAARADEDQHTETLRVDHLRHYGIDRNIQLSRILELSEHEGRLLKSVTIVYDSRLQGKRLAWLVQAVTERMDELPAGKNREITFVLDRPIEPDLLLEAQVIARLESIRVKEVRAVLQAVEPQPPAGARPPGSPSSGASS
jgi:hypothetical protein